MPESLLTILKFLLVALLYLFFFRVLRAVWAEVGLGRAGAGSSAAPAPAAARTTSTKVPGKLKVIEPKEQAGRVYALGEEVTLGRAAGCGIRVDDNYASQLHARVFQRDGQVFVEDLGSTNGTYVNRRGTKSREKVSGSQILRTGDRLLVGKTILEVTR